MRNKPLRKSGTVAASVATAIVGLVTIFFPDLLTPEQSRAALFLGTGAIGVFLRRAVRD